jgi:hypothetical protein
VSTDAPSGSSERAPEAVGARKLHIGGRFAGHPRAGELASAASALLHRYASEVVYAHRLCPFLQNVETGMGAVCVMLDTEADVARTTAALLATGSNVAHVLFPLVRGEAPPFERFGNKLSESVRKARSEPLVHASFHPRMVGGYENAHRMVGLLRRAPDPFVQFIPPGMQAGGTVHASETPTDEPYVESTFRRLGGPSSSAELSAGFAAIEALLGSLHHERERSYAALADEIAASAG